MENFWFAKISIREKKIINKKVPILNEKFHTKYKNYGNLPSMLMEKSELNCITNFSNLIRITLRMTRKESNFLHF